jgi:hypothetical protein
LKWGVQAAPKPGPAKKPKPFHRKLNDPNNPSPDPTMNKFKYSPAPQSGGGYTTRAVFGEPLTEATLTAAAAAAAGITPVQADTAIKAMLQGILAAATSGGYSTRLYGLMRSRPTAGGHSESPDGFNSAQDINAGVALAFTARTIAAWQEGLSLEDQGLVGKVTPVIDTVINLNNAHENEYTVGDMIELRGELLRFDKTDTGQGVVFIKPDGTKVRATVYGSNDPGKVQALVPAGLTGSLTICLMAFINGSVRCFTYTDPVTESV